MRKEFMKPEVEVIELDKDILTGDETKTSTPGTIYGIVRPFADSGFAINPAFLEQELGEIDYAGYSVGSTDESNDQFTIYIE